MLESVATGILASGEFMGGCGLIVAQGRDRAVADVAAFGECWDGSGFGALPGCDGAVDAVVEIAAVIKLAAVIEIAAIVGIATGVAAFGGSLCGSEFLAVPGRDGAIAAAVESAAVVDGFTAAVAYAAAAEPLPAATVAPYSTILTLAASLATLRLVILRNARSSTYVLTTCL